MARMIPAYCAECAPPGEKASLRRYGMLPGQIIGPFYTRSESCNTSDKLKAKRTSLSWRPMPVRG